MAVLNFRRYARVEVDIPVNCYVNEASQPVAGYLSNISEEGASLISPSSLPIAASLEFDIILPRSRDLAHVRADVLWSRPVQEGGARVFAHGVLFSRVGVEDRERLQAFINTSMSY
ncbi:MAG: PilZ domain-containing protein [candidate division FCPU426 bacterium]